MVTRISVVVAATLVAAVWQLRHGEAEPAPPAPEISSRLMIGFATASCLYG